MDILDLEREFEIPEGVLEDVLDDAANLLRASRANARTADKKALRGVAKALGLTIERVSDQAVRDRLLEAILEEPQEPAEDEIASYTAWWEARARVDHAIEGAQDLLALVRAGEEFKISPGRPQYDHWTTAIQSLIVFWTDHLRQEVTISGHASDPRGVKPSRALLFVHQCMHLLGEKITEQACRTILQNLRDQEADNSGTTLW